MIPPVSDRKDPTVSAVLEAPLEMPVADIKPKKPNTAFLKTVPETRELRDRIRFAALEYVKTVDKSKPLNKADGHRMTEELLGQLNLGSQYSGFALVSI